ncbi:hypothetical protein GR28A_00106 [Vibrio phage vB_VcorM_GR28A]|nr:hypothetical protein GR28A_00106 [Vibrio phage vB_VcorM_GR28A]
MNRFESELRRAFYADNVNHMAHAGTILYHEVKKLLTGRVNATLEAHGFKFEAEYRTTHIFMALLKSKPTPTRLFDRHIPVFISDFYDLNVREFLKGEGISLPNFRKGLNVYNLHGPHGSGRSLAARLIAERYLAISKCNAQVVIHNCDAASAWAFMTTEYECNNHLPILDEFEVLKPHVALDVMHKINRLAEKGYPFIITSQEPLGRRYNNVIDIRVGDDFEENVESFFSKVADIATKEDPDFFEKSANAKWFERQGVMYPNFRSVLKDLETVLGGTHV